MKAQEAQTATGRKVYRQGWSITVIVVAVSVLLLMIKPLVTGDVLTTDDLLLSLPYLVLIAVMMYPMIYDRVIVSETGLQVFRVGSVYSTSWDNIESIVKVQIGLKHGFALVLRVPALKANKWLAWRTDEASWMERQGHFMPLDRTIPLFMLIPNWINSELGQDIRRYAPHLFTKASQG
ncbi:MAG: hypothetical protein U0559_13825 [Anaerolineae bacterium]